MIWNTIPNEERLHLWKMLRDNIKDDVLEAQLIEVAKFCSTIPFGSRTLDYYSPKYWPTPWEVLFYGSFCKSSISLLMFYTLVLLPNEKIVELLLVEDASAGIYLLPLVNNQIILNYYLGEISNMQEIDGEFNILNKYTQKEIKTIN